MMNQFFPSFDFVPLDNKDHQGMEIYFWPLFLIFTIFYHHPRVEAYCWENLEFLESPLVKQIGKMKHTTYPFHSILFLVASNVWGDFISYFHLLLSFFLSFLRGFVKSKILTSHECN